MKQFWNIERKKWSTPPYCKEKKKKNTINIRCPCSSTFLGLATVKDSSLSFSISIDLSLIYRSIFSLSLIYLRWICEWICLYQQPQSLSQSFFYDFFSSSSSSSSSFWLGAECPNSLATPTRGGSGRKNERERMKERIVFFFFFFLVGLLF